MAELRGNKAIEDAAIAYVMERELEAGREPIDARYIGSPADIESPPRLIEVKAVGKLTGRADGFMWLETRPVETARENPDFYVYLVETSGRATPRYSPSGSSGTSSCSACLPVRRSADTSRFRYRCASMTLRPLATLTSDGECKAAIR